MRNLEDPDEKSLVAPWTDAHSYFAAMGGFAIEPRNKKGKPIVCYGNQRQIVTLRGLEFLFEKDPNTIPNIEKERLEDKSKEDTLSKILTSIQAIQSISVFLFAFTNKV